MYRRFPNIFSRRHGSVSGLHSTRVKRWSSKQSLLQQILAPGCPLNLSSDSHFPRSPDNVCPPFQAANFQQISWYHSTAPLAKQENEDPEQQMIRMAQQRPINFQGIEELLAFIDKETNMEMKATTFFDMTKKYARMRSAQSAEAAEQLVFDWMVKFHEQWRLDEPPQPGIIAVLLRTWVDSGHPSAAEKAAQLLDKIEHMARKGSMFFPIPTPTFNPVIKAYAIQGNTEKAQTVFDRSMHEINEGSHQSARPDVYAWNTLLDTCARSGNCDAWEVVEKFFGETQRSYKEGLLAYPPNATTYNSILNACAQCKQPQRAEFWLREMIIDFQNGNTSAQPNGESFGIVLYAHIKSRNPDAWKAAEDLLGEMQRSHKKGILVDQPDTIFYNSIINACAKSKQPERAEFWLREMHKEHKNGNASAQPDEKSFGAAIDAWARSGDPGAWKMAEELLGEMQRSHMEGILVDPPNAIIYNSIINACAKSKQPQRAEFWLREMHKDYANGNTAARPNAQSFAAAIDAWARSGDPDAWKMAEKLLREMQKSHKEGILEDPPDTIFYSSIINACAKSKQPQRSEFWLREMHKDYENGNIAARPNAHSFGTVIDAWARSGNSDAWMEAGELLGEMQRSHKEGILVDPPNTPFHFAPKWWFSGYCGPFSTRPAPAGLFLRQTESTLSLSLTLF